MDSTLRQILSALFEAHQTIDALRAELAAVRADLKQRAVDATQTEKATP